VLAVRIGFYLLAERLKAVLTYSNENSKQVLVYILVKERARFNDFEGILELDRIFPEVKVVLSK
jgi:hypothetical protein